MEHSYGSVMASIYPLRATRNEVSLVDSPVLPALSMVIEAYVHEIDNYSSVMTWVYPLRATRLGCRVIFDVSLVQQVYHGVVRMHRDEV